QVVGDRESARGERVGRDARLERDLLVAGASRRPRREEERGSDEACRNHQRDRCENEQGCPVAEHWNATIAPGTSDSRRPFQTRFGGGYRPRYPVLQAAVFGAAAKPPGVWVR